MKHNNHHAPPEGTSKRLPLICAFCQREEVFAVHLASHVLIYCEGCGQDLYATPGRHEPAPLATSTHPPAVTADLRSVEQVLLREVSLITQSLYIYLRRYVAQHGYAPTLREMAHQFSWRSLNTAVHHLRQLERAGLIERDYGEARGLRLPHAG